MASTIVVSEPGALAIAAPSDEMVLQRRNRRMRILRRTSIYALVVCGAFLFAFPLYWMVITSLAPEKDVFLYPPRLIPNTFVWQNYAKSLSTFPYLRGLSNTLIIAIGVEVGQLISVPIAAYAFARLQFPGRKVLFAVLIATLMLPVLRDDYSSVLDLQADRLAQYILPPDGAVIFRRRSRFLHIHVPAVFPDHPQRLRRPRP